MSANTRRWAEANPEKNLERIDRYKAQRAAAEGFYSDADVARIRADLQDRCGYCGEDLDDGSEIDHITPVSRGGSNDPSNLTLCCLSCNRTKGDKTLSEYREWRMERRLSLGALLT